CSTRPRRGADGRRPPDAVALVGPIGGPSREALNQTDPRQRRTAHVGLPCCPMADTTTQLADEVTDLLQHLIRNACVNDGTAASGRAVGRADLLAGYFDGSGIDVERYEPEPGRASLVARIEGSRPDAPSLLLMGHTDVVPANADRWRHDPFGGDLIEGEVW